MKIKFSFINFDYLFIYLWYYDSILFSTNFHSYSQTRLVNSYSISYTLIHLLTLIQVTKLV